MIFNIFIILIILYFNKYHLFITLFMLNYQLFILSYHFKNEILYFKILVLNHLFKLNIILFIHIILLYQLIILSFYSFIQLKQLWKCTFYATYINYYFYHLFCNCIQHCYSNVSVPNSFLKFIEYKMHHCLKPHLVAILFSNSISH